MDAVVPPPAINEDDLSGSSLHVPPPLALAAINADSSGASLHALRQSRLRARGGILRIITIPNQPPLSVIEYPGRDIGSISWEGGEALGRYIAEHCECVRGLRVVEVGCGLGVAGLAASAAGAKEVTLTDRATLLPIIASLADAKTNTRVAPLEWGRDTWRDAALPADVILGADVVYTKEGAEALAELLGAALTPCGVAACAYISYKERGAGDAWVSALKKEGICTPRVLALYGDHVIWELRRDADA